MILFVAGTVIAFKKVKAASHKGPAKQFRRYVMKKKIAVAVVIAGFGLAGLNQAYAGWGQRGGQFMNYPQYQVQPIQQVAQVDPAVQEKMDKFFESTLEIRKAIAMKRAEKQALLRSDNPDPAAASKIEGELFDLRTTMRQKADEAGVAGLMGPRDGFGKGGPGGKGGRMMNNSGYGQGYGQSRY